MQIMSHTNVLSCCMNESESNIKRKMIITVKFEKPDQEKFAFRLELNEFN